MMKIKKRYIIISLVTALILLTAVFLKQEKDLQTIPEHLQHLDVVHVEHVYDGDTVRTSDGERIRFIGIDTPEMNWDEGEPEFYAVEAYEYTQEKLLGQKIYLEYDQEKRDQYNRLLAYLYLEDGTFFNEKLLEKGCATIMTVPPNVKYSEVFEETEMEARSNERGIWAVWDELEEELPLITWEEAENYINEEVIVEGKIVNSNESDNIVFLNFTEERGRFFLVIFKYNLNKFSYNPLDYLPGKEIKVFGKIIEYEGNPEIIVDSPLQIKIVIRNNTY